MFALFFMAIINSTPTISRETESSATRADKQRGTGGSRDDHGDDEGYYMTHDSPPVISSGIG